MRDEVEKQDHPRVGVVGMSLTLLVLRTGGISAGRGQYPRTPVVTGGECILL